MKTKDLAKMMTMVMVMVNSAASAAEIERVIESEMREVAEIDLAMLNECNELV